MHGHWTIFRILSVRIGVTLCVLLFPAIGNAQTHWRVPIQSFAFWPASQQSRQFADPTQACNAIAAAYCSKFSVTGAVCSAGPHIGPSGTAPFRVMLCYANRVGGIFGGGSSLALGQANEYGTPCTGPDCFPCDVGAGMPETNLTIGWSYVPLNANSSSTEMIPGWTFHPSGCVESCRVIRSGPPSRCWGAREPGANGLYRASCDFPVTRTGEVCSFTEAGNPANPNDAPPACPGSLGTVNGKPQCLSNGAGQFTAPPSVHQGNPKAGTSPSNTNAEREPTGANGGGPDNRGGPGVTQGTNGSLGTGNNRTPGTGESGAGPGGSGTGSGTGASPLNLPTDYNREATQQQISSRLEQIRQGQCGGTNQPPCKFDEKGTPDGTDAYKGADSAAKGYEDAHKALRDSAAGSSGKETGWGLSVAFPSSCSPMTFNVAGANRSFALDPCAFQDQMHALVSFIWLSVTMFVCLGMVRRTITGG